jgi:molecular chaperone GrpE
MAGHEQHTTPPAERSAGDDYPEREDYSAAAPLDPHAPGTGETSFADAEAAPASERPSRAAGGRPTVSDGGAGSPAEDTVRQDLDELIAKAKQRDDYLALAQRTQADFENFRKRAAREKAEAGDRGMGRLAKELLPALDHLELALRATEEHEGAEDVVKGFRLVHEELLGALERVGIQGFSPQGEPFDPNEHEAMAQQPSEDAEAGTVIEVYQRGYRINGQVLRPARVVVAG